MSPLVHFAPHLSKSPCSAYATAQQYLRPLYHIYVLFFLKQVRLFEPTRQKGHNVLRKQLRRRAILHVNPTSTSVFSYGFHPLQTYAPALQQLEPTFLDVRIHIQHLPRRRFWNRRKWSIEALSINIALSRTQKAVNSLEASYTLLSPRTASTRVQY